MDLEKLQQAANMERAAHRHYTEAMQELNREVREAHKQGASLRKIAAIAHLSHESVRRVVSAE